MTLGLTPVLCATVPHQRADEQEKNAKVDRRVGPGHVYELAKPVFVARLQKYGLWHPDYKAMKVICRGKRNKPRPPC